MFLKTSRRDFSSIQAIDRHSHFLIPHGPDFVILHVIWPESQQTAALDLRGQKSISFLGRRGLTA